MARFVGIVLMMMVALVLLGFALAHLALFIIVLVALGLLGRHLRRHSV